jgi:hypothetical protein
MMVKSPGSREIVLHEASPDLIRFEIILLTLVLWLEISFPARRQAVRF